MHPLAVAGVEPYASRLKAKPDELVQLFVPDDIKIVVTGGETQGAFKMFGGRYAGRGPGTFNKEDPTVHIDRLAVGVSLYRHGTPSRSRFPVLTVEDASALTLVEIDAIETARVDVDLVRVGTRHIERMNAAVFAERVLRNAGVECVGRKVILAADSFELLGRDDQMPEALLGADRAVAIGHAGKIAR